MTIELYKGFPGSSRPWSRQLRQAILLSTADVVVGLAPVEGVLHKDNNLDSLGLDAPEFTCPINNLPPCGCTATRGWRRRGGISACIRGRG